MATGWEMLPETAKALSAPVTKLIEVVAAGCGKVYGPTDIKRTAAAQGEAMVLLEAAKLRANEVAMRAVTRVIDIETRRQENIEAISNFAKEQLPPEVSADPVDPDWIGKFFREAQDVSSAQMQQLWGKLLAGEVAAPGSFSSRTLTVVSNLGKVEAQKFEIVCALTAKLYGHRPFTFLLSTSDKSADDEGLIFSDFLELQAAGLITHEPMGTALNFRNSDGVKAQQLIERPGSVLFIATSPAPGAMIRLGVVNFTAAGQELFSIADWRPIPAHDEAIRQSLITSGWAVERRRIIERLPDGRVTHVPFPFPAEPGSEEIISQ
jgi:hypothetical protein